MAGRLPVDPKKCRPFTVHTTASFGTLGARKYPRKPAGGYVWFSFDDAWHFLHAHGHLLHDPNTDQTLPGMVYGLAAVIPDSVRDIRSREFPKCSRALWTAELVEPCLLLPIHVCTRSHRVLVADEQSLTMREY